MGLYNGELLGWVSIYTVVDRAAGKIACNDWCAANRPNGKDTIKNRYIDY